MSEPIVPVPVSLIQRTVDALAFEGIDVPELAGLLSQPNPTAEAGLLPGVCRSTSEHGPHPWLRDHGGPDQRDMQCPGVSAPPSIADMVPGTEFLCEGRGVPGVEHHMRVTEDLREDGTRILWCITHEFGAEAPYVDPSTIRDVTTPTTGSADA